MIKKAFFGLGFAAILFSACNSSNNDATVSKEKEGETGVVIPKQIGAVNDFEGILNDEDEIDVNTAIDNFGESTGNRIVVVTMDTIPANESVVLFASKIGNKWDIGEGQKNNGLIILLSEGVSQIGIAPGQGLEKVYNDSICDNVIRNMIPYLSVGDYSGGINKAITLLEEAAGPADK